MDTFISFLILWAAIAGGIFMLSLHGERIADLEHGQPLHCEIPK